jgi:hypothetical protein
MAATPDVAPADETLSRQLAIGLLAVPILNQIRFSTRPAYEALREAS